MLIQMSHIPVHMALAARVSSVPPVHSAPVASACGRVLDTGLLLSETGLSHSALHPVLRLDVWVGMYPQDQLSVAQHTCVVRISVEPARQGTSRQATDHAGCVHQSVMHGANSSASFYFLLFLQEVCFSCTFF